MFSLSFNTAVVSGDMECQRSARPGTEILLALQKLKKILHQKDTQNNSSVIKDLKSNASSRKLKAIDELKLVEEMKEEERGIHKVINGRKLLTDSKEKVLQDHREIEQLSKRLEFLEEENKIMKQQFLEHVAEKKKLANEIYKQFQTIYRCLQLENLENAEGGFDVSLLINPFQETGLPEVQDSVAINVSRGSRTNVLAMEEVPEGTWE